MSPFLRAVSEVKEVKVIATFKQPILVCGHKARLIKGKVHKAYVCFPCMNKAARKGPLDS